VIPGWKTILNNLYSVILIGESKKPDKFIFFLDMYDYVSHNVDTVLHI